MMNNIFNKIRPSLELENKLTLWMNHLLVLYTFLIPIHNKSKSSLFFVILVLFLYRMNFWKYLKEVFSNRIVQAFLIFYLINALGMLYTDNIDYGKDHMDKAKYLLLPLLFLSFLDIRFALRIVIAFILGMFFSEVFSYLIHYEIFPYEFSVGNYEIWETLAYSPSPFVAHSDYGVGISIVVGMLLYYLLNFKEQLVFRKVIASLLILVSLFNISFIASRTGYMTLVSVLFIVILLTYRKNIKLLLTSIILFIVTCFIVYNFSTTINERVSESINDLQNVIKSERYFENGSTGRRIGLSVYGMEVARKQVLIGVGTGDHMDLLREVIPEEQKGLRGIAKPHNIYVQILMQQGIVGFIGFLFLIYTLLSYKDTSKNKKDIMIIITSITLVFMAGGMFYGTFELPILVVFISAMIAYKKQDINIEKVDKKLIGKYFIFVILFLIIGITR